VLRWAHQNGCSLGERTRTAAARGGHSEVLEWLRQNVRSST